MVTYNNYKCVLIIEVTSGIRSKRNYHGETDPFDTIVSNLVKRAKRDFENIVKKK